MSMSYPFPSQLERTPLHERIAVVGLVILLHLLVLAAYWLQPAAPAVLVSEMSISFTNMQLQQAEVVPQPRQKPRDPDPVPSEEPATKEMPPQVAVQSAAPPSPVVLDTEPDYKADYLNNPRPPYPMVARRMGYHGKVVLDVEVLAEGKAGDVKLYQSSGYDILDNAALQTVKTWRFTPARRFGQAVTQRFLVPIKFSLEGSEA
jgi:protein TonB